MHRAKHPSGAYPFLYLGIYRSSVLVLRFASSLIFVLTVYSPASANHPLLWTWLPLPMPSIQETFLRAGFKELPSFPWPQDRVPALPLEKWEKPIQAFNLPQALKQRRSLECLAYRPQQHLNIPPRCLIHHLHLAGHEVLRLVGCLRLPQRALNHSGFLVVWGFIVLFQRYVRTPLDHHSTIDPWTDICRILEKI